MTGRLSAYVIDKLRTEVSFSNVAREVKLSVSTVIRIFDLVSYHHKNSLLHSLLTNLKVIQVMKISMYSY